MACSDSLLLQRLIDGDLEALQAEVLADHLETCDTCRAEARRVAELRAFVQERLGAEDEGEEEATASAVAAIGRSVFPPPAARPVGMRWWRPTWMATAAIIIIALLVPLSFLSTLAASPSEILDEAAERNRMWMYQPNKSLQWEVDTIAQGLKTIADGRWRTYFWRSNGATTFAEVSRQINPQGRTEFAYWNRADGSSVSYRARTGVVEIAPSIEEARKARPSLPEELRSALDQQLTQRSLGRSLDVQRRRDQERLHGRSVWISGGEVSFTRGPFDRWGEVLRITVVKTDAMRPDIVRAVHEYDIDSDSLRLLRLKTTITYTDGTTGVHDSRWVAYREISPAEFAAQAPDQLLTSGLPVAHLTPHDLATRRLQEMKGRSNQ